MSTTLNKARMRRFYNEMSRGNIKIIDRMLTKNFKEHDEFPGTMQGS